MSFYLFLRNLTLTNSVEEERQLFEEGGNDAILDMSAENPVGNRSSNDD